MKSTQTRRILFAAPALLSLAAAITLLPGCGGSSGSFKQESGTVIPVAGRSALRFTIQWPERPTNDTRQISNTANSIVISVTEDGTPLAPPKVVSRPTEGENTSVVIFNDLPVTTVNANLTAYASSDGTGGALSNGTTILQTQSGQTTETAITPEGTIASVVVTASTPSAKAGESVKLTASARTAEGEVVLTPEGAWSWSAPDGAVADFSSSGSTAELVGKAAGSAVVSAKETGSGAAGQATVTITNNSSGTVGLADSPWPVVRGNARSTGQGIGPSAAGNLRWKYRTGGTTNSPVIGTDGTVYVTSGDNYLYAMNLDGTLRWKFQTGSNSLSSPVVSADGTIYIATGISDQHFYAINADGTLRWKTLIGPGAFSSPSIGPDGTIYVGSMGPNFQQGDTHQYFYALNADGTVRWKHENGGNPFYSPTFGPDGTIYVGDFGWNLYALNVDGTLRWKFRLNFPIATSPAMGIDGTLYVVSESGYLYAVNPDGTQRWMTKLESGIGGSPAISADGTIYITGGGGGFVGGGGYVPGRDGGFLYAFNSDGTLRWKYQTEKRFGTSPAIAADGTIYVGNDDSNMYAFNPDGTVRWKYQAERDIKSSPAIGADGTIYFGSVDQHLYAIL